MKRLFLGSLLLGSALVHAQQDPAALQSNIDAVTNVQNMIIHQDDQRRWEAQKQADAKAAAAMREQKAREQAAAKRQASIDAARAQKAAKEQAYADANRNLDLEERKADLAMRQAKAQKAGDYASAELNRSKAITDVVQSEADVARVDASTRAKAAKHWWQR